MKLIEVVAAIIYNEKNKILIAKRLSGKYKEYWEFPGGKIENNETHKQALIREIKEELNIDIEVNDYVCTSKHRDNDIEINMHTYRAYPLSIKNILLSAHSEYKWINKKDIKKYKWAPVDLYVLKFL